jgi:hypothetical protein
MATKKTKKKQKTKKARKRSAPPRAAGTSRAARRRPTPSKRVYVLQSFLDSGPVTRAFVKKNKVVSRTIEIRGDQTLAELHRALFEAHDRREEHLYQFQFGKRPFDAAGLTYGPPAPDDCDDDEGDASQTTLDSLGLKDGRVFGYWFDFGDDWYHQVVVNDIVEADPDGSYPRVTAGTGASPPQHGGGR